jgi:16S rRNA (guanine966-N2)-methyltransferase
VTSAADRHHDWVGVTPGAHPRVKRTALGKIRIIGGKWKRRNLVFPARPGLRPTPDRVRETLFDWLGDRVQGARCLDLFSGSGALGFEAASRGAGHVVMVEWDRVLMHYLKDQAQVLDADNVVEPIRKDARRWVRLTRPAATLPFDVVFLDPPFASDLMTLLCHQLEDGGWLQRDADIYLEMPKCQQEPQVPGNWTLTQSGRAGQVSYYLIRRCCGPCD